MGDLRLGKVSWTSLAAIVASLGLEIIAHVVGCIIIGAFSHTQSGHGDLIKRIHVIVESGLGSGLMRLGSALTRCTSRTTRHGSRRWNRHIRARLAEVDIVGKLGDFTLGVKQTRLQHDDVLTESIVLGLQSLVILRHVFDLLDLFLQFADIRLLTLAEGPLFTLAGSSTGAPHITPHT